MERAARAGSLRRRRTWILGLALLPALVVLVVLQARWLGELAEAQHEVRARLLTGASERIAAACQRALSEVHDAVQEGRLEADPMARALVHELVELPAGERLPEDLPAFVARDPDGTRLAVLLDAERMNDDLFPALVRAELGQDALETYRVRVVSELADVPLYDSLPMETQFESSPDARADLRLVPQRWSAILGAEGNAWFSDDAPLWVPDGADAATLSPEPPSAPWSIELRHRDGSLELALARARRRNLLLSGGLLLLVLAGLALLVAGERRARRLAEKELAFVAGVSHELRTPLTVVRTAASNLERGVVREPAQVSHYGQLIEREATRVSGLVERVLRFAGGEQALVFEEVDLEHVVRAASQRCEVWRDRKSFQVEVDVAEGARRLRADGAALTSLVHNLIENAIKYGDDGQTILVRARVQDGVELEVSDQGPGIPAADRAHVFEPFYRGSQVRAGNLPGSGLGLGVAREVAQAHGGRLELLEIEQDVRGATFSLHLPARVLLSGQST